MRQSRHFYVQLAKCEQFLREFHRTAGRAAGRHAQLRDRPGSTKACASGAFRATGPYFGFRIPGTENKYFYVWLDAPDRLPLVNRPWCKDNGRQVEEYWAPQSGTRVVHFIGKDIVYFHALFWPVMLKNSEFNLPSTIFVHGFLNIGGEKMSKSRGTFILAKDFLAKIKHPQAPEYLRFFFAAKLAPNTADIDLSVRRVRETRQHHAREQLRQPAPPDVCFLRPLFRQKNPCDAPWDETIAAEVETAAAKEIEQLLRKGRI